MLSNRSPRRIARSLAGSLAVLAVAAPVATAMPVDNGPTTTPASVNATYVAHPLADQAPAYVAHPLADAPSRHIAVGATGSSGLDWGVFAGIAGGLGAAAIAVGMARGTRRPSAGSLS